jgi:hypothetical protein
MNKNGETNINETPICLPCGTKVAKGMKIYTVETLTKASAYEFKRQQKGRFLEHSGKLSTHVVEHTVIAINQAANARSFTVRSDRGCEHTFTVKGMCLPDIYVSKAAAAKKRKAINMKDVDKLFAKIKAADLALRQETKRYKERKNKYRIVINKLLKAKYL